MRADEAPSYRGIHCLPRSLWKDSQNVLYYSIVLNRTFDKVFHNFYFLETDYRLTLCILMDFPIQINTIRMRLSIIYFKVPQVESFKF